MTEPKPPICGEDFCDYCGDCLACYGGDPCIDGGNHQEPDRSQTETP